MESVAERFIAKSYGSGDGDGSGYGSGYGDGYGYGYGSGYGDGYGYGSGSGDGSGYGSGYGDGYGYGSGSGYGYGYGVKSINGQPIHDVDGVQTIISKVKGNLATGFILGADLQLSPCYIAKYEDYFAHGKTAREALIEAKNKAFENATEEERIERFLVEFPDGGNAQDLFNAHGWLTGSCLIGREQFVKDKGIDMDGSFTLKEFVDLCKDAYGGEIVRKLLDYYNGIEVGSK